MMIIRYLLLSGESKALPIDCCNVTTWLAALELHLINVGIRQPVWKKPPFSVATSKNFGNFCLEP